MGGGEDVLESLKLQERPVEGGGIVHADEVLAEEEPGGVVLPEAWRLPRGHLEAVLSGQPAE